MRVSVVKPGSPAELVHFGIKGQKWGVRKQNDSMSQPKTSAEIAAQKAHRKQVAKKVAIGVSAVALIAGTAFVAYKLNKSGKIALPKQNRGPMEIDRILREHGSVKLSKTEKTAKAWTIPKRHNNDNTMPRMMTQEVVDMLNKTLGNKTAREIYGPLPVKR